MEEEIKMIEDRIASLEESNKEYERRYGTGTRPAWVGEEIGINMMYIEIGKRQIAELKGQDK